MSFPCVASMDLGRHEREVDRAEARDRAIEQRARLLVMPGEDCYPFDPMGAAMALEERCDTDLAKTAFRHLAKAAETKDKDCFESHAVAFTREMVAMLSSYWDQKAKEQAKKEIR